MHLLVSMVLLAFLLLLSCMLLLASLLLLAFWCWWRPCCCHPWVIEACIFTHSNVCTVQWDICYRTIGISNMIISDRRIREKTIGSLDHRMSDSQKTIGCPPLIKRKPGRVNILNYYKLQLHSMLRKARNVTYVRYCCHIFWSICLTIRLYPCRFIKTLKIFFYCLMGQGGRNKWRIQLNFRHKTENISTDTNLEPILFSTDSILYKIWKILIVQGK